MLTLTQIVAIQAVGFWVSVLLLVLIAWIVCRQRNRRVRWADMLKTDIFTSRKPLLDRWLGLKQTGQGALWDLVVHLYRTAIAFVFLYGLVKFVKWAWYNHLIPG